VGRPRPVRDLSSKYFKEVIPEVLPEVLPEKPTPESAPKQSADRSHAVQPISANQTQAVQPIGTTPIPGTSDPSLQAESTAQAYSEINSPGGPGIAFQLFKSAYPPNRFADKPALREWIKLAPELQEKAYKSLARWKHSDQWTRGLVPEAANFLRERKFEIEPIEVVNGNNSAAHKPTGAVHKSAGDKFPKPPTLSTA
jgi:hypothetical protein